jgi:hypothetical protein
MGCCRVSDDLDSATGLVGRPLRHVPWMKTWMVASGRSRRCGRQHTADDQADAQRGADRRSTGTYVASDGVAHTDLLTNVGAAPVASRKHIGGRNVVAATQQGR